jgi:hypothetical protein
MTPTFPKFYSAAFWLGVVQIARRMNKSPTANMMRRAVPLELKIHPTTPYAVAREIVSAVQNLTYTETMCRSSFLGCLLFCRRKQNQSVGRAMCPGDRVLRVSKHGRFGPCGRGLPLTQESCVSKDCWMDPMDREEH